VQTVMTDKPLRIPVMCERDAAVRASGDGAAVDTLNKRGISAAIEEQNALLSAIHGLDDRIVERLPNHCAVVDPTLSHRVVVSRDPAQIDHFDAGQSPPSHSIGEREKRVLARRSVYP